MNKSTRIDQLLAFSRLQTLTQDANIISQIITDEWNRFVTDIAASINEDFKAYLQATRQQDPATRIWQDEEQRQAFIAQLDPAIAQQYREKLIERRNEVHEAVDALRMQMTENLITYLKHLKVLPPNRNGILEPGIMLFLDHVAPKDDTLSEHDIHRLDIRKINFPPFWRMLHDAGSLPSVETIRTCPVEKITMLETRRDSNFTYGGSEMLEQLLTSVLNAQLNEHDIELKDVPVKRHEGTLDCDTPLTTLGLNWSLVRGDEAPTTLSFLEAIKLSNTYLAEITDDGFLDDIGARRSVSSYAPAIDVIDPELRKVHKYLLRSQNRQGDYSDDKQAHYVIMERLLLSAYCTQHDAMTPALRTELATYTLPQLANASTDRRFLPLLLKDQALIRSAITGYMLNEDAFLKREADKGDLEFVAAKVGKTGWSIRGRNAVMASLEAISARNDIYKMDDALALYQLADPLISEYERLQLANFDRYPSHTNPGSAQNEWTWSQLDFRLSAAYDALKRMFEHHPDDPSLVDNSMTVMSTCLDAYERLVGPMGDAPANDVKLFIDSVTAKFIYSAFSIDFEDELVETLHQRLSSGTAKNLPLLWENPLVQVRALHARVTPYIAAMTQDGPRYALESKHLARTRQVDDFYPSHDQEWLAAAKNPVFIDPTRISSWLQPIRNSIKPPLHQDVSKGLINGMGSLEKLIRVMADDTMIKPVPDTIATTPPAEYLGYLTQATLVVMLYNNGDTGSESPAGRYNAMGELIEALIKNTANPVIAQAAMECMFRKFDRLPRNYRKVMKAAEKQCVSLEMPSVFDANETVADALQTMVDAKVLGNPKGAEAYLLERIEGSMLTRAKHINASPKGIMEQPPLDTINHMHDVL